MAKRNEGTGYSIGRNVHGSLEGSKLILVVDLDESGPQTKNSQKRRENGALPSPQEMVASTDAFRVVTVPADFSPDGAIKVMLHVTRPMEVKAVRKARALRELAEDDDAEGVETQADVSALKDLAKREGVSLSELVSMLKGS